MSEQKNIVVEAFKPYEHFCKTMLDAYIVIDTQGNIVKANQLFATLINQPVKQILKAGQFTQLLSLKVNGSPLSLEDIVNSPAPTRIDEVIGSIPNKEDMNFIIGIYPFNDPNGNKLGCFVLLRDVTAETNLQGKYKDKSIQSITDPLTGLYTRNYFTEYLQSTESIARRQENPDATIMSVLMLDIDHFKKVNDQYGHPAGDYVIKNVAEIIKKTVRKSDICCRYGGEEFLILLPGAREKNAGTVANSIRKNIEAFSFEFEGKKIPITASLGAAQLFFSKEEYKECINRADQALYQSKHNGRNQVTISKFTAATNQIYEKVA